MFSHQEERILQWKTEEYLGFEPKRLHQKFKVQSASFLSVPLVKETAGRQSWEVAWSLRCLGLQQCRASDFIIFGFLAQMQRSPLLLSRTSIHDISSMSTEQTLASRHRQQSWTPRQDPWKAVDDKLEIASLSSVERLSLPWAWNAELMEPNRKIHVLHETPMPCPYSVVLGLPCRL